jgi:hypothetical protein
MSTATENGDEYEHDVLSHEQQQLRPVSLVETARSSTFASVHVQCFEISASLRMIGGAKAFGRFE